MNRVLINNDFCQDQPGIHLCAVCSATLEEAREACSRQRQCTLSFVQTAHAVDTEACLKIQHVARYATSSVLTASSERNATHLAPEGLPHIQITELSMVRFYLPLWREFLNPPTQAGSLCLGERQPRETKLFRCGGYQGYVSRRQRRVSPSSLCRALIFHFDCLHWNR